jgi:predicted house-cleaning noncanonical NTP pyrophosphatase (MazG superfamily)
MSKLVRDGIPEVIRKSGREPMVSRISGEELKLALKEKLVEEASELKAADDIYEELADVLEVVDAIIILYNIDRQKLENVKNEKNLRVGGFHEGYYLHDDKHKV